MSLFKRLLAEICTMPVIDSHEHLPPFEEQRNTHTDVLQEYLTHYMSSDMHSAGMSSVDDAFLIDTSKPLIERWLRIEPFWEAARFTGYGQALDRSVKGIYQINGINRDTIEELNDAFTSARANGSHFPYVLKDLCGIETCFLDDLIDSSFACDQNLFRRVWCVDKYVKPNPDTFRGRSDEICRRYKVTVKCLDDWMEACERELVDGLSQGVIGLKTRLAYERSLYFASVGYAEAKSAFQRTLYANTPTSFSTTLQDFMMRHILALASKHRLVIQVHTGLQEGNGNIIGNSDPSLLNNVLLDYPETTFVLFHMSYPYQGVAATLCKMFPNVVLDLCWAHIISPTATSLALAEMLDSIPYNKIIGFGGDYIFVDGVYGHLEVARENISRVLVEKVGQKVFSEDAALKIAQCLLYHNPKRIFNI